jgi:soluble lytic murein transglycosylase-like protein
MGVEMRALLVSLTLGALSPNLANADVFAYTDDTGVTHYSNVREHDRYQLIVAVLREEGRVNTAKVAPMPKAVAEYAPHIEAVAEEVEVDKALLHAVITAESGYNANALSPKGAMGLMQLMPGTAKRYTVENAFDAVQNIRGGAFYLRDLMRQFDNDLSLVLAAYNAGENAVLRHGRQVPPYKETQAYVPKVLALYNKYRRIL